MRYLHTMVRVGNWTRALTFTAASLGSKKSDAWTVLRGASP